MTRGEHRRRPTRGTRAARGRRWIAADRRGDRAGSAGSSAGVPRCGWAARSRASRAAWPGASAASAPSWAGSRPAARRSRRARATAASATRAWTQNWLFRRLMQAYLAAGGTVAGLVEDAELDWRDRAADRGSCSTTCSTRSRRRTSRSPTRRCSRRRSIAAAQNLVTGALRLRCATPPTAGCRRWSTPAASRSAATSASARLGRAAHRRVRADPVPAARPRRSTRRRC